MNRRQRKLLLFSPLILLMVLLFIAVGGEVVKELWNWLLPLFGVRQITFWQALGILALCRILFGGLGRHGVSRSFRGRMGERMAERMAERWDRMTPEEREKFRRGLRGRCGFDAAAPESEGPA